MAFSFIRSTNAEVPPWETRASTRAAALSDAMSIRCSTSLSVNLSPAFR